MFQLCSSAILLLFVSLSDSCSLGKVQGCTDNDDNSVEICAGSTNKESNWLPICHEHQNEIVRCQNGLCGTFPLELKAEEGAGKCCSPQIIIRTSTDNSSNCMDENKFCCETDKVLCYPFYVENHTVEYVLGGSMVLVIILGMFLGWVISFCYWNIRKPRFDGNLDDMIQTRLETNTYAMIAPPPMAQNMIKPPQPSNNKIKISPDTSSISSEIKRKPEDDKVVVGKKTEGQKALEKKKAGEDTTKSSDPHTPTYLDNKIELSEEEEHVEANLHVTVSVIEVENHEIPHPATSAATEEEPLIDLGTAENEAVQELTQVEIVGEEDGDSEPLLAVTKGTTQNMQINSPSVESDAAAKEEEKTNQE